ncbi:hypothetical protein PG993_014090 [Apiospora rasikravindrae]|uniref:Uncharacterized protein n=1 Tax=Apiospora rasikravindrae TaxID=990691 RepID=A0ABR1RT74_9PEZI
MRNAYTVYDQDDGVFRLAQVNYSTDEDVVLFMSRGAAILSSVPGLVVRPSGPAYNYNQPDLLDFPIVSLTTLAASAGIQRSVGSQNVSGNALRIGLGFGISVSILLIVLAGLLVWV